MIAQAQIAVQDVEKRVIKQGTPDQRTIYDVIDREGTKWTAWEKELAEQAWNLRGQIVNAKVKIEQSGKWTNRNLIEIGDVNPAMTQVAATVGKSFDDAPVPQQSFEPAPSGTALTPKDTTIHRQTASKVAATIAAESGMSQTDFWLNVEALVRYYETGETPFSSATAPQQTTAAHDPGPFEPVPDDDIPF